MPACSSESTHDRTRRASGIDFERRRACQGRAGRGAGAAWEADWRTGQYTTSPADAAPVRAGGPSEASRTDETALYSERISSNRNDLSLTPTRRQSAASSHLNMRRRRVSSTRPRVMEYVKKRDPRHRRWEQRLSTALVKSTTTELVRDPNRRRHGRSPKVNIQNNRRRRQTVGSRTP